MNKPNNTTSSKTRCNAVRAGEILGTTQAGVYMAANRRQIPYRKFGRRLVFFEEDLFDFLERQPGVSVDEALAQR